jgi:phage terminase small subunit
MTEDWRMDTDDSTGDGFIERAEGTDTRPLSFRRPLNPRQLRFVREYASTGNATQSAISAGYRPDTAGQMGYQLLQMPRIREAADEERARIRAQAFAITPESIIQQLARMAFFDPRALVDEDGKPIPIKDLPDEIAACIQAIDVTETPRAGLPPAVRHQVRFTDRIASIDRLMRHKGMFQADNDQRPSEIKDLLQAIHASGKRLGR